MILSHSPVKAFDTERLSIVKILLKAKKTFSSWQNVERWRFAFRRCWHLFFRRQEWHILGNGSAQVPVIELFSDATFNETKKNSASLNFDRTKKSFHLERRKKSVFLVKKSLKIGQFDPHFRLFNNQYSKYFFWNFLPKIRHPLLLIRTNSFELLVGATKGGYSLEPDTNR